MAAVPRPYHRGNMLQRRVRDSVGSRPFKAVWVRTGLAIANRPIAATINITALTFTLRIIILRIALHITGVWRRRL